ncbi:hypothetical protein HYT74_02795 [Candidatus Daviesbacteria bacterium]|nr:hypothetical protein [Candidatus Daviesbacteria bacterium]
MQNIRTQIYLPEDLRQEIDKQRYQTGESLAQYLRTAAEERVKINKKRKVELKKLADELGKEVKKSGWEGIDVLKWQREIRKDRKIL